MQGSSRSVSERGNLSQRYITSKEKNKFSQLFYVKRTVSYLVHHHPKLKVSQDNWQTLCHDSNNKKSKSISRNTGKDFFVKNTPNFFSENMKAN
jgi:hypothetical protein